MSKIRGSSSRDAAIGAGIGVPVAALSLLGLGLFLYRKQRRREIPKRRASDIDSLEEPSSGSLGQDADFGDDFELNDRRWTQELNTAPADSMEPHSRQSPEMISPI